MILAAVLTSFMLLLFSCSQKNSATRPEEKTGPEQHKAWTFLLYDDADFYNAYDPLDDFAQVVSSGDQINYLVLRDSNTTEASYYKIGTNHEKILLERLGELNMGDPGTLENFINYGKKNYPADRYIVAFYDHGDGWEGVCWDTTNQLDNLTAAEMNTAIRQTGGTDLILFTAPCAMGSLEAAYQVRDAAQYYVGSEDASGFVYWYYLFPDLDLFIKSNPLCTTEELANKIVNLAYEYRNAQGVGSVMTLSSIKLSELDGLVSSFNRVVNYYSTHVDSFKAFTSKSNMKRYGPNFCDFLGLLESLYSNEKDPDARQRIEYTMDVFKYCITAEKHGGDEEGSNGMNIYFPQRIFFGQVYSAPYSIGLDFKRNSGWEKLVVASLTGTNQSVQGMPNNYFFRLNGFSPR